MKNFKKLSRGEMKVIGGAGTCAIVGHFSDGSSGILPYSQGATLSQARKEQAYVSGNLGNGEANPYGATSVTYCCDSCSKFKTVSTLY